jgi:hypothetical protein
MNKQEHRHACAALIAATWLVFATGAAAEGPLWRTADHAGAKALSMCAAFDLLHVTHIEAHAGRSELAPSVLASAFSQVLEARSLCVTGRHQEALSLYSSVPLGPPIVETIR